MRLAICVCRRRAALALVVMLGSALLLQQENLGVARAERVLVMPEDLTLPLMSRLRQDQLDTLFIQGEAAAPPAGFARGKVLLLSGYPLPRVTARSTGLVWKGKQFGEDDSFINQWRCFRAIASHTMLDTSWYDGQPCVILEYPPGTPLFGRMRDEMRQIRPGLYLLRCYQHTPTVRFRGYIALESKP